MARVFDDVSFKKEITRKEFLRYMLGVVLLVFGVSNFITALRSLITHQNQHPTHKTTETAHGFGASKFGA